jgi:hypothetical protein
MKFLVILSLIFLSLAITHDLTLAVNVKVDAKFNLHSLF